MWPAWFGIVYILLDLVLGKPNVAAKLEDRFGGRVCPMILVGAEKCGDEFLGWKYTTEKKKKTKNMMAIYDGHSRICWLKVIVAYGNLIS